MFGKHKHLEEKLRETGRSAPAQVLSAQPGRAIEHGDPTVPGNVELEWKLELCVKPEREPEFTAAVTARGGRLHGVSTGQIVTVLYDPEDHGSVVVDTRALEEAWQARIAQAKERASRPPSPT